MPKQTSLYDLGTGFVLDRSVFANLGNNQMSEIITALRAGNGKPFTVVDSADQFFNVDNLIVLVAKKDPGARLVNQQVKFFTEKQLDTMFGANNPGVVVVDDDVIHVGANAGYKFAEVPAGWSISNNVSLGPTKIKRKIKNSDGDGVLFYMHPTDVQALWTYASAIWSGAQDNIGKVFNTGQGKKQVTVMPDRISLGGNHIRRYEIEQIAKYRGWGLAQAA